MGVLRWVVLVLSLALVAQPPQAAGQARGSFANPAEYDNFQAALKTGDPSKRATAMEVFAWYPNSILRTESLEHAMAAWMAAKEAAKADFIAGKLLQIDPDNVHALAHRVYAARARAVQGDKAAIEPMVAGAERGVGALAKWQKPASIDDATFVRTKEQMSAVFNGALGYAALGAKDYDKARRYYRESVAAEPDNLQDVYQLAVSQLEGRSTRWASGSPRAPSPSRGRPRTRPPPPISTATSARATASIAAARRAGTSCWRASSPARRRRPAAS